MTPDSPSHGSGSVLASWPRGPCLATLLVSYPRPYYNYYYSLSSLAPKQNYNSKFCNTVAAEIPLIVPRHYHSIIVGEKIFFTTRAKRSHFCRLLVLLVDYRRVQTGSKAIFPRKWERLRVVAQAACDGLRYPVKD